MTLPIVTGQFAGGIKRHERPEFEPSMQLSSEQIDIIAERAAEKAIEKVYIEIGRNVVRKVFYLIGVGTIGLLVWLGSTGRLS